MAQGRFHGRCRYGTAIRGCLLAAVLLLFTSCTLARLGGRKLFGAAEMPVSFSQARVRLSYSLRTGTFRVARLHNSIRLSRMATHLTLGDRTFASTDKDCTNKMVRRDALRMIIRSTIAKGPTWETQFEIQTHPNEGNPTLDRALKDGYGVSVTCRMVDGATTGESPHFSLVGRTLAEKEAFACRLAPTGPIQRATGGQPVSSLPSGGNVSSVVSVPSVLQIASGEVASGLNTSFYDPHVDCALHLDAPRVAIGESHWRAGGEGYPVRLDFAQKACLDFVENFYKTVHGFSFFDGVARHGPPAPIAGWLDWYVTYGKTDEARLLRNVNWLAANLRDYGLDIIQIDDGWQADFSDRLPGDLGKKPTDWLRANSNFPHGMAWLAEQIHTKGFKAGIWLVPYATNNAALVRDHPDWFLPGPDGKPQTAQGKWAAQFGYLLDLANPKVENDYLAPLFKTLSSRWRYDYFKLDATGWTLLAIKDQHFNEQRFEHLKIGKKIHSGAEVIRDGLDTVRRIIGNKTILACHAPCPEVVGLVDAARVAGDMSPGWERGPLHLLRETMESFYTHRICWLNDPDCMVIRPPLTLDQVRLYVSMFGLTGQLLMLSDEMDQMDSERIEAVKRILPVCPTTPLDLFSRKDNATVWDLKIERPFGMWDVLGVFNFTQQPVQRTLRFSELGIVTTEPCIVYDFWNRQCLGRFEREVTLDLHPTACRVLTIHPETGQPQIISTNRHITQGGVDLVDVKWNAKRQELTGRSRVVAGDPYELRVWVPEGYRVAHCTSSAGDAAPQSPQPNLSTLRLSNPTTADVRWLIRFERTEAPGSDSRSPAR